MIELLKSNHYVFADYNNNDCFEKCVIMRHDVDNSIDKALELAKIENSNGVNATYFVLLGTPFYNICNKKHREKVLELIELGHNVGLHFDETNYVEGIDIEAAILNEARIMSGILQYEVGSVSMHRPSKKTVEANYTFNGGLINSYSAKFFNEFKYVSDSRRRWREDVCNIIQSGKFNKLHILTHAFWYHEENKSLEETIKNYILEAR